MLRRLLYVLLFLTVALQATVPTEQNVAKLYVGTFNRAPDAAGLKYWLNDSGLTLEGIARSFFEQPETQKLYPEGYSNQKFVEAIYANLFGRIPDVAGAEYWLHELETGKIDRSIFILAAINGALGDDAVMLENKTIVGLVFANAGMNNIQDAREIMKNVDATSNSVQVALNKFEIAEKSKLERTEPSSPTPPSIPLTPTPPKPKPKIPTAQKGWFMRIDVEANTLRDSNTVFGYLKGASDNKDKYDSQALESSGLYSVIYNENFEGKKEYRSDYRAYKESGSKTEVWILRVKYSKDKYADVTINWNGITYVQGISGGGFTQTHKSNSPELERMRLVDMLNGEVIDVSQSNSYTFNMDGKDTYEFEWVMLADGAEEPTATKPSSAQSRVKMQRINLESSIDSDSEANSIKRFDPPFE